MLERGLANRVLDGSSGPISKAAVHVWTGLACTESSQRAGCRVIEGEFGMR